MYFIIFGLNEQNKIKSKWIQYVKSLLFTNGYSNIWENQHRINIKWLKATFKQKLLDQWLQTWNQHLDRATSSIFKNLVVYTV